MKAACTLAMLCSGAAFGQGLPWWLYSVPERATACQVSVSAAELYKNLEADGVSVSDLRTKFPNVRWTSGKMAVSIVVNPKDGDLVRNSIGYANGTVRFRLIRQPALTKSGSSAFVVELERGNVSKPACTWSMDNIRTTIIRQ